MQRGLADVFPKPEKVVVVAFQLGLGSFRAGGADDQAHALRNRQTLNDALQPAPIGGGLDLAGNAATPGGVGHQDAIAARQGKVGGERRALVAALFLDHLHQHDLPTPDDFLDLVTAHQPPATPGDLFLHDVVIVARDGDVVFVLVFGVDFHILAAFARRRGSPAAIATRARFVIVFVVSLFAHQRFAVGERNLIVVRVDFVEGQEAVAIAAIFDEGRLQRRLNTRHLGEIDIASELFAVGAFEIKFFNAVPVDHHHTRLFGVGGVYQHRLGHFVDLRGARRANPSAAGK